jgi:hypothetical protein
MDAGSHKRILREANIKCTIEKEGDEFIAQFPDMTNIVTSGFSQEEALVGCLRLIYLRAIAYLNLFAKRGIRLP